MGLLDNYTGVGMSPRPKWQHQRILNRMLVGIYHELVQHGYEPLSEATVTDDWDDLAPDLVIFDENHQPLSVIEITTHKECKAIIRKCYELIDRFPDAEYFVFDYETGLLFQYDKDDLWLCSDKYEIRSRYLKNQLLDYLV